MNKSKSYMSFEKFTCKKRDLHNFGNDWGLFIDIERNYRKMYFKKKHFLGGIYVVQVDYDNENDCENDCENYIVRNDDKHVCPNERNINEMYVLFEKIKQFILNNIVKYGITFTAVSILTCCILFVL